jgi:hypothetical protein
MELWGKGFFKIICNMPKIFYYGHITDFYYRHSAFSVIFMHDFGNIVIKKAATTYLFFRDYCILIVKFSNLIDTY